MRSHISTVKLYALQRHLDRLERRIEHLEVISQRYTRSRWAVVFGGILAAWLSARFLGAGFGWVVVAVSVIAFVVVASYHNRVKASMLRYLLWSRIKIIHVARMIRKWRHIPRPPEEPSQNEHPYATDLNLTGPYSVLQLLDTTMSRGGSERLRSWLLYPNVEPDHIRARQDIVRELIPLAMFRDRLALHGSSVTRRVGQCWEGEELLAWLERESGAASLLPWVILLGALAVTNVTLYALHAAALVPLWWPFSLLLYLGLYMMKSREVRALFADAFRLETTLKQFRAVLLYLETYRYDRTPHLANLCAPFWRATPRPSAVLKRLVRVAGAASAQKANIFGVLLNVLVPWDLYFAYRFHQCKEEVKPRLPVWIETWYELEALNALANFGHLHPDYVFPDVLAASAATSEPVLHAEAIGHPLLRDEIRVGNDVTINSLGDMLMITGSNMSGKSTFLRTLGVNLCLAYAGAPVNASRLQTIAFRVFACINVTDSVTDGISYFYAEVRRLKALLQALHTPHEAPLFFMIDEIFRGTNNRERLLGSRAYIQELTGNHGVGVISTHDLDLIRLVDEVPVARNCHFREEIVDGRMVFDYLLRQGPCPTTNALTIMQMEGLPVPASYDRTSSPAGDD